MKYRFGFWLSWILLFVGALTFASLFWTVVLRAVFSSFSSREVLLTWALAVFGSWFLLVIPFMWKKEKIWKRLNPDEEASAHAWLGFMLWIIGMGVVSALLWSWVLREKIQVPHPGFDPHWAKAVGISWLLLLIPALTRAVQKADRIFNQAALRQIGKRYRKQSVEREKRLLSDTLHARLGKAAFTLPGGQVVHLILKDGRRIPHVFIKDRHEILGVYDRTDMGFSAEEVEDLEVLSAEELPPYEEHRWLRLD